MKTRATEDIVAAWLRSRGLRLIPSERPWGRNSDHAKAVRDLAKCIEDAWCASPTREIDPEEIKTALEMAARP